MHFYSLKNKCIILLCLILKVSTLIGKVAGSSFNCNMNGTKIRAITVMEGPHVIYDDACLNASKPAYETYLDISSCAKGWMVDFMAIITEKCNATIQLLKPRYHDSLGDVVFSKNGSLIKMGLYAEIDKFDMILSASVITEERARVVKYLYPVTSTRMGFFIKNDYKTIQNDWLMYLNIFTPSAWVLILTTAILPSALISTTVFLKEANLAISFKELIKSYLAALAMPFGGHFFKGQNKIIILLCHFFYGIMIWIYFRGSLTSKLTHRSYILPFKSLEELSQTSYYISTEVNGTLSANDFHRSPNGSIWRKLLQGNMKSESFVGVDKGIERMMTESQQTFYSFTSETKFYLSQRRLQCHALIPWQTSHETPEAMPVRKDFPYFDILDMETKTFRQSGLISLLISRYRGIQTQCDEGNQNVEIGYEKVALLFLVLFGAACIALFFLFVIEVPFFNISSYLKNNKSL